MKLLFLSYILLVCPTQSSILFGLTFLNSKTVLVETEDSNRGWEKAVMRELATQTLFLMPVEPTANGSLVEME